MSASPQRAQSSKEGVAIRVHSALGPGLLEKAYKACLAYELRKAGLDTQVEVELPVFYEELRIDVGFRADMIVKQSGDRRSEVRRKRLFQFTKPGLFRTCD